MSRGVPQDLDCIVAVERVTEYLEGAMRPDERARFEEHLAICRGCLGYLRQIEAQIRATRALGGSRPPPEEVTQRLLEMFRASRGR
jgi:anti-sigma factor (TIGR02949 family)